MNNYQSKIKNIQETIKDIKVDLDIIKNKQASIESSYNNNTIRNLERNNEYISNMSTKTRNNKKTLNYDYSDNSNLSSFSNLKSRDYQSISNYTHTCSNYSQSKYSDRDISQDTKSKLNFEYKKRNNFNNITTTPSKNKYINGIDSHNISSLKNINEIKGINEVVEELKTEINSLKNDNFYLKEKILKLSAKEDTLPEEEIIQTFRNKQIIRHDTYSNTNNTNNTNNSLPFPNSSYEVNCMKIVEECKFLLNLSSLNDLYSTIKQKIFNLKQEHQANRLSKADELSLKLKGLYLFIHPKDQKINKDQNIMPNSLETKTMWIWVKSLVKKVYYSPEIKTQEGTEFTNIINKLKIKYNLNKDEEVYRFIDNLLKSNKTQDNRVLKIKQLLNTTPSRSLSKNK